MDSTQSKSKLAEQIESEVSSLDTLSQVFSGNEGTDWLPSSDGNKVYNHIVTARDQLSKARDIVKSS